MVFVLGFGLGLSLGPALWSLVSLVSLVFLVFGLGLWPLPGLWSLAFTWSSHAGDPVVDMFICMAIPMIFRMGATIG